MARIELSRGAWLDLDAAFLDADAAERLQAALVAELAWEQRHIVLFGKRILQPRLIAWMGELPYRYSGQTLPPRPWPRRAEALLGPVVNAVTAATAVGFNHVLINRYRDGNDSMGYHADAEPELGPDPPIACLSLGRTRRFLLRSHGPGPKARPLELALSHGSLLVMGGTCQRYYRHAIPRAADAALASGGLERISLTFRRLLRAPGG